MLVASGVLMVVAGVAVGIWQGPAFLLIAALGLIDLALAWAFASGRIRLSPSTPPAEPPADDPSYNPYARED